MNRKTLLPLICGIAVIMLSASTVVSSGGISRRSGSPVDGGLVNGTCGVSGCHSGGSSTPTLSITTTPTLTMGNGYVPGQTYTITITPSGSYPRYGTNCEIINSQSTNTSSVQMFGAFGSAIGNNTQIYTSSQTTPYPPCVSHTFFSSTTPFQFTWTAPLSGTGYLYAVVNGVNINGQPTGDQVSAVTTITLTPMSTGVTLRHENSFSFSVFPNPAIENIHISYTLAERGNISLNLISGNGELVVRLLEEIQDRGNYSTDLHLPTGLPKGNYFVKLLVNGKPSVQKLMII